MFGGNSSSEYDEIVGEVLDNKQQQTFPLNIPTAKTTDENLTSENWELIMNLCDKVAEEGPSGCAITFFILVCQLIVPLVHTL